MFKFLKNAIVRGLVVLIPLVLIYLTLRELFEAMVALATPIADLMPADFIQKDDPENLIAVILILLTALILGLIWSAGPTRRAADMRGAAIKEKALGPNHPDVANDLNNLATLYIEMGQLKRAQPL